MAPTIMKVSELTKEKIGDLYFESLTNKLTRPNHILLGLDGGQGGGKTTASPPSHNSPSPPAPNPNDVRADFTCWYGGFITLAHTMDPNATLPPTQTMAEYVSRNFERAKEAIAA